MRCQEDFNLWSYVFLWHLFSHHWEKKPYTDLRYTGATGENKTYKVWMGITISRVLQCTQQVQRLFSVLNEPLPFSSLCFYKLTKIRYKANPIQWIWTHVHVVGTWMRSLCWLGFQSSPDGLEETQMTETRVVMDAILLHETNLIPIPCDQCKSFNTSFQPKILFSCYLRSLIR